MRFKPQVGLLLLLGSLSWAAPCQHGSYVVSGRVLDGSGRPLSGARVHVLLDKVSQKKFVEHGVRARSTRTDASGRYRLEVVCGRSPSGRPNPCGRPPKHLSLLVDDSNHRTTLKVYKLKALATVELEQVCAVEVPRAELEN